jgi:hypothetical protein
MLARADRHVAAMVAAVIAWQIKLPGAVLVAYVALDVLRRSVPEARRARLLRVAGAGALTAAATALIYPNAFGWLGAMDVPGTIRSAIAPSTWVSYLLAGMTGQLDAGGLAVATTIGRVLVALGGTALIALLLRQATEGSARAAFRGVGWALVVLSLTGPVTYPWYLTWGLFAAAVGSGTRGRLALLALSIALMLTSGQSGGTGVLVAAAGLAGTVAVLWRERGVLVEPRLALA